MTRKHENPLQPGVTGSGVPFSQLDTTGYDFGGSMSQEEIDEALDRMENDPEFAMDEEEGDKDCEDVLADRLDAERAIDSRDA